MLHENGWDKVCVWRCSFSADFCPNARKHILHLYFLMFKCTVIKCLFRLNWDEKVLPQSFVHTIPLSLPWLIWWLRIMFISIWIWSFILISSCSLIMHNCCTIPRFKWVVGSIFYLICPYIAKLYGGPSYWW